MVLEEHKSGNKTGKPGKATRKIAEVFRLQVLIYERKTSLMQIDVQNKEVYMGFTSGLILI